MEQVKRLYTFKQVVPFFKGMGNEEGKLYQIMDPKENVIAACMTLEKAHEVCNNMNNYYDGPLKISDMYSENTGGGCMVDIIILSNGFCWTINEEAIVHNKNIHHFWEGDSNIGAIYRPTGDECTDWKYRFMAEGSPMCFTKDAKVVGEYLTITLADGMEVAHQY